eukprot:GHRR01036959.1.p1 GENE.GHRR01036959.1~~GHRR01036959.1.p1  ORF type:complete len:159 (-),score=38.52 GHRR01036959.1:116-592(-)
MYNNSWCSTNVGCLACLHRHGILLPCCAVSLCSIIVMHCQAHSFELDVDTTKFGEFVRGGIVTQHKETKILSFKKLSEALEAPGEFLLSDFSKIERSPMLHVAFQALDAYQVTTLLHRVTRAVGSCISTYRLPLVRSNVIHKTTARAMWLWLQHDAAH